MSGANPQANHHLYPHHIRTEKGFQRSERGNMLVLCSFLIEYKFTLGLQSVVISQVQCLKVKGATSLQRFVTLCEIKNQSTCYSSFPVIAENGGPSTAKCDFRNET